MEIEEVKKIIQEQIEQEDSDINKCRFSVRLAVKTLYDTFIAMEKVFLPNP